MKLEHEVAEREAAQKRRANGIARQNWRARYEPPRKGKGAPYRRQKGQTDE